MNDTPQTRPDPPEPREPLMSKRRYHRLLIWMVLATGTVAVLPLVVMTWVNYLQYEDAFHAESVRPISRLASNAKRSLEFFLEERLSALSLVAREKSIEDLQDPRKLRRLFRNIRKSFGGFIDLGVIDNEGKQIAYVGPYRLMDKVYKDQDWFHEVRLRDVYLSDVFLGHRKIPHFVMAVRHEFEDGKSFVLRATIDTDALSGLIRGLALRLLDDSFLINRQGILQTPSRAYGGVLKKCPLSVPPFSTDAEVMETEDKKGNRIVVGYAYVKRSPFILMLVGRPGAAKEGWISLRRELLIFLGVSILVILTVVVWGSRVMVSRIREADLKRGAIVHQIEYAHRMAVIGRLAAGVAHEINNPLEIINEKAGLLGDLLTGSKDLPREKLLGLVASVLGSVERCGAITHRLLGFAKHMAPKPDSIRMEILLNEVLGFLEKEAHYRGITVSIDVDESLPTIESDRGQLQQVFLNIINNAMNAVKDGGKIEITAEKTAANRVAVNIADNGVGIPEENLDLIFDPFFTTDPQHGTGLGLSITYGIVEKLGGDITVKSKVGQGTTFTVTLPFKPRAGKKES